MFIHSFPPSHPRERVPKRAARGGSLPSVRAGHRARPSETTIPRQPRGRRKLRLAHSRSSRLSAQRPLRSVAAVGDQEQRRPRPRPRSPGPRADGRSPALTSAARRRRAASAEPVGLRLLPISCLTGPLRGGGRAQAPCSGRRLKIAGAPETRSPRGVRPRRRSTPCARRSQARRKL